MYRSEDRSVSEHCHYRLLIERDENDTITHYRINNPRMSKDERSIRREGNPTKKLDRNTRKYRLKVKRSDLQPLPQCQLFMTL